MEWLKKLFARLFSGKTEPIEKTERYTRFETFFYNVISDIKGSAFKYDPKSIAKLEKDKNEVITHALKILPKDWEGIFFLPIIPHDRLSLITLPHDRLSPTSLIEILFQNGNARGTYKMSLKKIWDRVKTPKQPYWLIMVEFHAVQEGIPPEKVPYILEKLGLTDNEILSLSQHNENWRKFPLICTETVIEIEKNLISLMFKFNNGLGIPEFVLYDKNDKTRECLVPTVKDRKAF